MRVLIWLALWALLQCHPLPAADANRLARQAAQAARQGDYVRAHTLYAQAARLQPYGSFAAQSQAMLSAAARRNLLAEPVLASASRRSPDVDPGADLHPASGDDEDPLLDDDEVLSDRITDADLRETQQPLPPIRLQALDAITTHQLTAPLRKLWEDALRLYGLEVVFDEAVRDGQPVRFALEDASYRDTIRALELSTNTLAFPVTERLLLIAPNDPNVITRLEPTAAVAIPIPTTIQTEDAQEIANALRQALEIRALMVDGARRLMLVRDRYARVLLAEALAQDLMNAPQDLVLDVEFREVNRRSLTQFGIRWPTNFPATLLRSWLNHRIRVDGALSYLGFSANPLVGIGVGAAEAVASMTRTDSRTIYHAQIRVNSGREATLNLGQQYPVVQQGFLRGPTNQPGASAFFPQVQFRQLGFALKAKPYVWRNEVTVDLDASVELLTGDSVNGIPVFSNRETVTRVRVEAGQTIVIAGLMNREEAVSLSGLAGLSRLPGISALFRQTTTQREDAELLILLTPRLVQSSPRRGSSPPLYSGTATRFLAPL